MALVAIATLAAQDAGAGGCDLRWSLAAEWSEEANPAGVWSWLEGDNFLPHVEWLDRGVGSWTKAQPSWSRAENGNTRLPAWLRSNGTETFPVEVERCDILVHSTDATNGVGAGDGSVVWTSPLAWNVSVDGAAWMVRDIDRSAVWKLFHNDTLLTEGALSSGDQYSRSNPFRFEDGSGGREAVEGIEVEEGDRLRLVVSRTSNPGDFVGVRLRVLCGDLPDETTTTTLQEWPACGDAVAEAGGEADLTASDALRVLRTAVKLEVCERCVCDTNDDGQVVASDALLVLRAAVSIPVTLDCGPCSC